MRAMSLFVSCALSLGLGGCKSSAQKTPPPAEQAEAATAKSASPLEEADAAASAASSDLAPYEAADPPPLTLRADAPTMRYARLGREACLAELGRRAIPFEEAPPSSWAVKSRKKTAKVAPPAGKASKTKPSAKGSKRARPAKGRKPGKNGGPKKPSRSAQSASAREDLLEAAQHILAPVRLRGPLHGITIHSALPEKVRATSPFEVFDCRLVLALDDFASILAEHDVVEVIHMSAFRPQRDRGCTPKFVGKQHCGALALDVGVLKKKDGSTLDVDRDWNGRIGLETCTAGAGPNPETPAAKELWDIVCASVERGLFHVVLTPNYNAEHKNHLHLEVTPGVSWTFIH